MAQTLPCLQRGNLPARRYLCEEGAGSHAACLWSSHAPVREFTQLPLNFRAADWSVDFRRSKKPWVDASMGGSARFSIEYFACSAWLSGSLGLSLGDRMSALRHSRRRAAIR